MGPAHSGRLEPIPGCAGPTSSIGARGLPTFKRRGSAFKSRKLRNLPPPRLRSGCAPQPGVSKSDNLSDLKTSAPYLPARQGPRAKVLVPRPPRTSGSGPYCPYAQGPSRVGCGIGVMPHPGVAAASVRREFSVSDIPQFAVFASRSPKLGRLALGTSTLEVAYNARPISAFLPISREPRTIRGKSSRFGGFFCHEKAGQNEARGDGLDQK
jgi:hypothetical protein